MATGDQNDIANRLYALLPRGWFPDLTNAPVLNAILQGLGAGFATIYGLLAFVKAQMRLGTAQGGFIDLTAADYFGPQGLPRFLNETDAAYIARIEWNLTAPRATRAGLIELIESITGRTPVVIEPANTGDTGGYATPGNPAAGGGTLAYDNGTGTVGAGCWGSLALPAQVFLKVYRPRNSQVANVAGYATPGNPLAGGGLGGYGSGAIAYVNPSMIPGTLTDSFIYQQIAAFMPAGSIAWVYLTN